MWWAGVNTKHHDARLHPEVNLGQDKDKEVQTVHRRVLIHCGWAQSDLLWQGVQQHAAASRVACIQAAADEVENHSHDQCHRLTVDHLTENVLYRFDHWRSPTSLAPFSPLTSMRATSTPSHQCCYWDSTQQASSTSLSVHLHTKQSKAAFQQKNVHCDCMA